MLFESRCQPRDSWHSKGQRENSEKRTLLQNQLNECDSAILYSVVTCCDSAVTL